MINDEPVSVTPHKVKAMMQEGRTFVLNIVTLWCPDCTERQAPHFAAFTRTMQAAGIPVFNLVVQHQKLVFLSAEHQLLVDELGGHGYPRTCLFVCGQLRESHVEVMKPEELDNLAKRFIKKSNDRTKPYGGLSPKTKDQKPGERT